MTIKQCYSEGEISSLESGGITGSATGRFYGIVRITNSYSRGRISGGSNSGGICSRETGASEGTVIITSVYAGGDIAEPEAGGIIGHFDENGTEINITMSVYNGGPIVAKNKNKAI